MAVETNGAAETAETGVSLWFVNVESDSAEKLVEIAGLAAEEEQLKACGLRWAGGTVSSAS